MGITVFDKKKFVESVIAKGRSLDDIVREARAEISRTESRLRLVIGALTNGAAGSSDHVQFLHSLVFFLISEVKVRPARLSDDDFHLLFLVAKYLVDRGNFKPAILELFGE